MSRSTAQTWGLALMAILIAPCFVAPVLLAEQSRPAAAGTLPRTIALFPLPDVTLFPSTTQPFHIFEPRYRAMVADALAGDSIIGMVMLQPGHEAEYEGRPPVYAIGCAGIIVSSEELPDGRFNIVLRGLTKFRILSEDQSRPYRLAQVDELPEVIAEDDRQLLSQRRRQLEAVILARFPRSQPLPADLPDQEVIDGFSLVLPLEPARRQELLEADGPIERASSLMRFLGGGARASL